jgi:hypothetical protein
VTHTEPRPDPDAPPDPVGVLYELTELADREAAVTERKLRAVILARALGATWVQLAAALGFANRHSARSHHAYALRTIASKDGPHAYTPSLHMTQRQARDYLAGRRSRKDNPNAHVAP